MLLSQASTGLDGSRGLRSGWVRHQPLRANDTTTKLCSNPFPNRQSRFGESAYHGGSFSRDIVAKPG